MVAGKADTNPGVVDLYGSLGGTEQIVYPSDSGDIQILIERILRDRPPYIALTDGAFDVPTDNHAWWLRDCRFHAAKDYYRNAFVAATRAQKMAMVASSDIFLIVTVDADQKVARRKGGVRAKGGIARPVYDWASRAHRVGGYMIPNGRGEYRPDADLVTVEGDPRHMGTPLESHITLGLALDALSLLDSWLLSDDHPEVDESRKLSNHVKILPKTAYAADSRTGEMWTSSYIIGRMKADADGYAQ